MGPYVDSVASDEAIPASTNVVVIGGGIIGTSAALALAARGIPVVLCEKGYIACEQSSRNWGWCRQAGRDEREMPLIVESLRLWRDMDRLTEHRNGVSRVRRHVCRRHRKTTKSGSTPGSRWRGPTISAPASSAATELKALMPGAQRDTAAPCMCPSDGCAEPQKAAPAIARAAQRMGAIILAHCAVRGIDRAAGRVNAVITERGTIACEAVILAGRRMDQPFLREHRRAPAAAQSAVVVPVQRWLHRQTGRPPLLSTTTFSALLAATRAGLGLAVLPVVSAATLVAVLPETDLPALPVWLVVDRDARRQPHIAAFFEILRAEFARPHP